MFIQSHTHTHIRTLDVSSLLRMHALFLSHTHTHANIYTHAQIQAYRQYKRAHGWWRQARCIRTYIHTCVCTHKHRRTHKNTHSLSRARVRASSLSHTHTHTLAHTHACIGIWAVQASNAAVLTAAICIDVMYIRTIHTGHVPIYMSSQTNTYKHTYTRLFSLYLSRVHALCVCDYILRARALSLSHTHTHTLTYTCICAVQASDAAVVLGAM